MNKEVLQNCISRGLSIHKIAKELDVSFTTIRHWLKHHELETQPIIKNYLCSCGETNPAQFYQKRKTLCKSCFNEQLIQSWRDNKVRALKHRGGCCSRCGYKKYIGALEFHHRTPTSKECAWDKMCRWTWNRIVAEIDKCDILCANCHREVHEDARNSAHS